MFLPPDPSASLAAGCRHCHGPVGVQGDFCCAGCETVFHILKAEGWGNFYQIRDRLGQSTPPVATTTTSYAYLNSQAYREKLPRTKARLLEAEWWLANVHCAACLWLVEKAALSHPGIQTAELGMDGRLSLSLAKDADLNKLAERLADLGYPPQLGARREGAHGDLLRLGVAGALAANLMLFSVPFYSGLNEGTPALLFGWLSLLLCLPLLFFAGRPFFTRAWFGLRHGNFDFDVPIALGLAGAMVTSTVHLVGGRVHQLYFDSMGMLVFFLLVGRYVQARGVDRALASAERLMADMPRMIQVFRQGAWTETTAETLNPGERFRMRAGDLCPVDAVLQSPRALLNLQVVTGESHPVDKRDGDTVAAGSVNLGGVMECEALTRWDNSGFSRLKHLSRELAETKHAGHHHPAASWFFGVLSLIALLGFVLWLPRSLEQALEVVLAVYLVACPCALALARPSARALAMRYAAAIGVLIKTTRVFDRLPLIERVVFDKTGVLTLGKPAIAAARWFSADRAALESALYQLESAARHPLAEAFAPPAEAKTPKPTVSRVQVHPGLGISGVMAGLPIAVTGPHGLAFFGKTSPLNPTEAAALAAFPRHGTPLCLLVSGRIAALFSVVDPLRPGMRSVLETLAGDSLDLAILSGDAPATVRALAAQLGISAAEGGVMPWEKPDHVKGRTLMIGDGLNDMGALAAADLGFTHDGATGAALEFADVIFRDARLDRLPALWRLAAVSIRAERRGLAVSLLYNAVAVTLVLTGHIGPLQAALLMPLSSLSMLAVVAATFRAGRASWAS